jgi:hypothetical protein
MINLAIEFIYFFLTLFFLMPILLILAVAWHAVTNQKRKHSLSHRVGSGDVMASGH